MQITSEFQEVYLSLFMGNVDFVSVLQMKIDNMKIGEILKDESYLLQPNNEEGSWIIIDTFKRTAYNKWVFCQLKENAHTYLKVSKY